MTGCVCHDDVHVVPGTLDPWPPFKYGNVSATPSPARSVAPKRSLSALEAPLNQHLRALRLEKACSVGSSLQEKGCLGPETYRHLDACKTWHAPSHAAGVSWTAPCSQMYHETQRLVYVVTGSSSCYLLPNPSSKLANIPTIVTDRTTACPGRHSRRWHWPSLVPCL